MKDVDDVDTVDIADTGVQAYPIHSGIAGAVLDQSQGDNICSEVSSTNVKCD